MKGEGDLGNGNVREKKGKRRGKEGREQGRNKSKKRIEKVGGIFGAGGSIKTRWYLRAFAWL